MKLSEKIYLLRKEKGMTQDELASRCNVSRQSVSKWEATDAKPDIDSIRLLANTFEMSIDDFLNTDVLHPSKPNVKRYIVKRGIFLIPGLIISLIIGLLIGFYQRPRYDENIFELQQVKIETIQMDGYVQLTVKPSHYDKDVEIDVYLYKSEDLGNNHDPRIVSMNAHDDALAYTAQFSLPSHYLYADEDINTLDCYDITICMKYNDKTTKLIPLWADVWYSSTNKLVGMRNKEYHNFNDSDPYYEKKYFTIDYNELQ